MSIDQPAPVDNTFLNDLILNSLASRLPNEEQRAALAWASRLREVGNTAGMSSLLEGLLAALNGGQFPLNLEPPPSRTSLPEIPQLPPKAADRAGMDLCWAHEVLAQYSRNPAPSSFLRIQPKPRAGAACYMAVFGGP